MAAALFAGHQKFARDVDGRWRLRGAITQTVTRARRDGSCESSRSSWWTSRRPGSRATHGDRVTEIAAVLVRGGVATTVFDTLINPERPIPPQITALTNITSAMVRSAPTFAEVCEQLLGVLEGHVFVAHNATFDWRFISMEVERATGRRLEGVSLCTVRMLRRLVPHLRRRNLDAVAAHYGIEITARHRAGGDAVATAQVFLRLLEAARAQGCATLDDVQRLVAQRTGRQATPAPARASTLRVGRQLGMIPQPLVESRTLGRLRIHAIQAGGQRLDGGAMFGVVPKPLWEKRIAADERNRIQLGMRCLLIEHDVGLDPHRHRSGEQGRPEVLRHLRHREREHSRSDAVGGRHPRGGLHARGCDS